MAWSPKHLNYGLIMESGAYELMLIKHYLQYYLSLL